MNDYKASIICIVFNEKYEFEDVLLIGMADNKNKARALLMDDIWRVMENFGSSKCELEESRSEYDEPITVVHTHDADNDGHTMHWHYYCLFDRAEVKPQESEVEE